MVPEFPAHLVVTNPARALGDPEPAGPAVAEDGMGKAERLVLEWLPGHIDLAADVVHVVARQKRVLFAVDVSLEHSAVIHLIGGGLQ